MPRTTPSRRGPRPLLAALLVAAGSLAAGAAEIETARGPVTIDAVPGRVAVYDIAAIDTLDRLGVVPAGVPENLYLPELRPVAERAERVGSIFEPDLEALNALEPDLVIVGGRSSPRFDDAAQVAPTIDMTIADGDLVGQARARIAAYGALFGREAEAAEATAELDAAIADARAAAAGKGRALILMTNGAKISAYGPGSRFGWIHSALGLAPAAEGLEAAIHGEAVSFEFVAQTDPDWLIVVDRSSAIGSAEASGRATLDNELVARTKAWQRDQVIFLPAGDVYIAGGGARAMIRTATALAEALSAAD
jgi:iron complex transport system substrate-binding protein